MPPLAYLLSRNQYAPVRNDPISSGQTTQSRPTASAASPWATQRAVAWPLQVLNSKSERTCPLKRARRGRGRARGRGGFRVGRIHTGRFYPSSPMGLEGAIPSGLRPSWLSV